MVGSVTVKLNPPFSRPCTTNGNGVAFAKVLRMVGVVVYVFHHLENSEVRICRTLKIIFKNGFVPPHSHVPARD